MDANKLNCLRSSLYVLCALLSGCASQDNNVKTLRAGYDALNAHQYDQAMTAANKVLAANPQKTLPAEAHYLRGRAFEAKAMNNGGSAADLQNARNEYIAAVGMPHAPNLDGRARAGVAIVAYYQEDFPTAFAQWQEALTKLEKPEDRALTQYRLGQTAQRLGRWSDADAFFAQVQQNAAGTDLANRAKQHQGARNFNVQLATFANPQQANQAVAEARKQGVNAMTVPDAANPSHLLLRVGPMGTYGEAKAIKAKFAAVYPNAVIIP
jgi:tetratricopeptide (TPR) repeat protein